MQEHEPAEKDYDLERLIFFSDGVFAIVITLLVIELRLPAHWDLTLAGLVREEGSALLAYLVSFMAVGAYWNLHRQLFRHVVRFHPGLVFFNLLLLGFVVLIPFGAELIVTGSRQAFAIYLALFIAVGLAQAILWSFAAYFSEVTDPHLDPRSRLGMLANFLSVPLLVGVLFLGALFGAQVGAAWVSPIVVVLGIARWVLTRRAGLRG
ncbi:MAG TPA: TMEM175 family protein [Steroidobacteraceae bacterium]